MVPNTVQSVLVFRTDFKSLLNFVPPCFQTPLASLCKCDISSGTKSYLFLCGNNEPLLAGCPLHSVLSKEPLFALPQLSTPTGTWLRPISPQRSAESSRRGMRWPCRGNQPQPRRGGTCSTTAHQAGDGAGADPHAVAQQRWQRRHLQTGSWAPCKVTAFLGEQ